MLSFLPGSGRITGLVVVAAIGSIVDGGVDARRG